MSRFSPNVAVQDRSGEILAQALSQTFQQIGQRRREKKLDTERTKAKDEQRAAEDLTLALQGIRRGQAPDEAPVMQAGLPMATQFGQIPTPARAPQRFTQLTDQFYRDDRFVADQAKRQQESALADALFKARLPQMVDPEGFALSRKKTQAEIGKLERDGQPQPRLSTVTTGEGVFAFDPTAGELVRRLGDRPVSPAGTEPNWHTVQTDQGVMQVNPKTGATRAVQGPDGGPLRPKAPAQITQAVSGNRRQLKAIDATIELLRNNPKSVGLRYNVMPDALSQVFDPKGVLTRAGVSDVGSLLIHDRTGAAMNASESVRLKPFIPGPGDQSAAAIQKLERLKQLLTEDTEFLSQQYGIGAAAGTPQQPAPLTDAQISRAQSDPSYRQFLLEKGYRL